MVSPDKRLVDLCKTGPLFWALCLSLILSISANHASAQSHKCEKYGEKIENLTLFNDPQTAPDVTFHNLDHQETSLKDLKGKVVFLNNWAMWCAPCLREMPDIMRLSEKVDQDRIAVIALSMDQGGVDKVIPFVERQGWKPDIMFSDSRMAHGRVSGISSLPATQIYDPMGREVARFVGVYEWHKPEVTDFLKCLSNAL